MDSPNVVQLYGGIVAEISESNIEKETISSGGRPGRSGRKKVSKSPNSNDEGRKGKRGRPRVDAQDLSAVERRRTQIRLAQRAYRERKEITISALETRVAHLQQTVNKMNQTFLDYNDKAVASGIISRNLTLGEDLKFATQRFLELTRNASTASDGEEEGHGSKAPEQPAHLEAAIPSPFDYVRHLRKATTTSDTPMGNLNHPATILGYEISYNDRRTAETRDLGNTKIFQGPGYHESSDMTDNRVGRGTISLGLGAEVPSIPTFTPKWNAAADQVIQPFSDANRWPYFEVSGPRTYSFLERTFSRRLLRLCYERTYYLLTDPNSSKEETYRTLRYTFHVADAKKIAARLRELLPKSSSESLDNWDVPLLHIGGAGLHYPRVDPEGETPLPSNWSSLQSVAPYGPRTGPLSIPDNEFPEHLVKYANMEGPWFDSNDVEQYLRTKGLLLDGQMSVAEIEVDEPVPSLAGEFAAGSPNSLSSDSFADPQSPRHLNDMMPGLLSQAGDEFSENPNGSSVPELQSMPFDLMATDSGIDFAWPLNSSSKDADDLDLGDMAMFPKFGTFAFAPHKKTVKVDVDRLLEALVQKGVCLGRTAGFRREDVDSALSKAVMEAL
ncbi:hypothetical protein MMC13_008314 [Lambiella insularis]|nr:hypothetical protein [Lambiella insularis]